MQEIIAQQPLTVPKQVLASAEPIIIRNLVENWDIVKAAQQSKQAVAEKIFSYYSGEPLLAFLLAAEFNGRLFYNKQFTGFNFERVRGRLDKILAELFHRQQQSSVATCYVGSTNIEHWLPGFNDDHQLTITDYATLASIWMGNQSTVAAHFDFPANIACCVAGKRRFSLFAPEQIDNLYIGPIDFTPAGQPISTVDIRNPDYGSHPKFKIAQKNVLVAELEPGDAIFIPSMWWHQVEALADFNVLVNYWWRDSADYLGSPFDALLHNLLALRDLPKPQRDIWQNLINYYVFENNNIEHIPKAARGILNPISKQNSIALKNKLLQKI